MAGRRLEKLEDLDALLAGTHRIAVLGIKPESQADRPAHYVPRALQSLGYEILPVPVYPFGVETILGQPVAARVQDLSPPVDLVDVFRRSQDVPLHLSDLLAAHPRAVWLQSGIRNEQVADALLAAGIDVVQDRCLMVECRRFLSQRG